MKRGNADGATKALVERDADRYVDLRMDFELDGELVLSVGGRWDRRVEDFDGEAETGAVVRPHPGQARALAWWRDWLAAHHERRNNPPAITDEDLENFELDTDPAHVYSALFAGGRRGGKSWLAVAMAVSYAVAFPGAIVWIVSPSAKKHDEVRRYGANVIIPDWLEHDSLGGWDLVNGSRIVLKSGYEPEDLKEGEAHLVILNEAQRMKRRAFTVARGAIVDKSGLVIACANPPVEAGDEAWVSDLAADSLAGKRASVYVEFNPLENPHIDRRALLAMAAELDERTFDIEVLGRFRTKKDAVAHNWNRLENERAVPESYLDATEAFFAKHEEGSGILQCVGLDVQRFPYIGGPVYRFFVPPDEMPSDASVLAWIVDEIILEGGDEADFCAELEERGYARESTLIVCDASGRYQHSRRRSADSPPPTWTGRGSFDIIRGEGYRRIVPPSRMLKKNPDLVDRTRAFTSMICSKSGRRRLFADPSAAPQTCAAIREWKHVHGKPSRTQYEAHLGDGASYPIVRLFPRIIRSGKPGSVDSVTQAVDRKASANMPLTHPLDPSKRGGRGRRGF
jgi:hypothetical protein